MSSEAGVVLRVILDLTVIAAEPVRLATITDDEAEARELAAIHLEVRRAPAIGVRVAAPHLCGAQRGLS